MRFKEAVEGWTGRSLTQEEAASLLGVCARPLRRDVDRFDDADMEGWCDQRRSPVDEVMR